MTSERFEPIDLDGLDAKAETLERCERRYVLSRRVVDNLAPFLTRGATNKPSEAAVQVDGTTIVLSRNTQNASATVGAEQPKTMLERVAALLGGGDR